MMSRGLRIFGSGTFSTCTLFFPHQTRAFMVDLTRERVQGSGFRVQELGVTMASAAVVVVVVGVAAAFAFAAAADPAARAAGLALRRGDFAGFHELLEAAQVFFDLLPRLAAEELGDGKPDAARGGDVVDHDAHFRALPAGAGEEPH